MYSKTPIEIKPPETSNKLTYANSFEYEFSLLLRETRSVTFLNMQEATLEVESNMLATSKLKEQSKYFDQDKKRKKEMTSTSMGNSSGKMDDTNKLIKNLSTKVNRLEMENINLSQPLQEGNPNQFRRPFVPIFLPRERRNNDIQREGKDNEDQRVQPPFQNNLLNEDEEVEEL